MCLPGLGIFIHCPFGTPDGPQSRITMQTHINTQLNTIKHNPRIQGKTSTQICTYTQAINHQPVIFGQVKVKQPTKSSGRLKQH